MPTWARKALNTGLLTPLIKGAAPPGMTLDSRPTNARDSDGSVWTKATKRAHASVVAGQLGPQQLGVSIKDGVQIKAAQERIEALQTARPGEHAWADLVSAHHADTGRPSRI